MASDRVDMSVGKGQVNGDYGSNGVAQPPYQRTAGLNGDTKLVKPQQTRQDVEFPPVGQARPYANGVENSAMSTHLRSPEKIMNVEQLPQELLDMLAHIPLESFLPMAQLISRSAQTCWADLHRVVDRLSTIRLNPPRTDQDRLSNGHVNDTSIQNREKKALIWEFAKRHKDVLVKLLVLLQSGKRMEDVRRTIALNFFLHERRNAFNNATFSLGNMVRELAAAQIPNPDLATAAEVLATGKISSLPDLGYVQQLPLTPAQILATLSRLNTILCTRMALQDGVPSQMSQWHVHDGRVTFSVPQEFELDLSLADEKPEANFGMVDVRFLFTPAPSISESMHGDLANLTNNQMERDGLTGAYNFLHELTLSYKLIELHKQALTLAQGQWAGHLKVELHRRTLVVQYWLKRAYTKSWIEIGIHSGRTDGLPDHVIPSQSFLRLQWTREGKRVNGHEIVLNTNNLSIENVLHQAIAQQTNHIFDSVYTAITTIPLYQDAELAIEQTSSFTNPHGCGIDIQASMNDTIKTSIEPISGSFILAPVNERSSRLQYELLRSRNIVDEFSSKIVGLRCAVAETRLLRRIMHTGWEILHGLKISVSEIRELFGINALRATFFRQANWNSPWKLAASFGSDGDRWWLVSQDDITSKQMVQRLEIPPLHLERTLSRLYFSKLEKYTAAIIALQCNAQAFRNRNIRCILHSYPQFSKIDSNPTLVIELNRMAKFLSLRSTVTLKADNLKHTSDAFALVVTGHFSSNPAVLRRLASTDLGPSIKIFPEFRRLTISFSTAVGESVIEDMILKLRQVDDIVSCVTLLYRSKTWDLQSCSMQSINLIYDKSSPENLSLAISLGGEKGGVSARLLPEASNPHALVSPHVSQILMQGDDTLSVKLSRLLSILHMSLPLVRSLQKLQNEPEIIKSTNLGGENSQDWLRVHIMARDISRFGIHFFSKFDNFQRDVADSETPRKMLARFEIEPQPGKDGALLTWILRPAIEEYSTYSRPSFAAKSLSERLTKEIFANIEAKGWLALDTAAKCKIEDPQPLLNATYQTILGWLKEASKVDAKADTQASDTKQQPKTTGQTGAKQNKPVGQTNNTKAANQGGQSSRVMTAAPQQVRNAQNNQQRQQQGGLQQQRNNKATVKKEHEVISID